MQPKTLFYFAYSRDCFLQLSKSGRWLKVELKGSYFQFTKNYQGKTCKHVAAELNQYCFKLTGKKVKQEQISQDFAKQILMQLEKKQLKLF